MQPDKTIKTIKKTIINKIIITQSYRCTYNSELHDSSTL